MRQCKYCREPLEEGAIKCKTCGEPLYIVGKVLKFTPLFSTLIAVGSLAIACTEIKEKHKATQRADAATKAHITVSQELTAKESAADLALSEIAQQLPVASKRVMINNLQVPSRTTLKQLEEEAKAAPSDTNLQRKVFLYRALKEPE